MEIAIGLEAIDRGRNLARRYNVEVSADLFGHHTVDLTYGRIDGWGRTLRLSSPTEAGAVAIVRSRLLRRATAGRRIGAGYQVVRSRIPAEAASRLPKLPVRELVETR